MLILKLHYVSGSQTAAVGFQEAMETSQGRPGILMKAHHPIQCIGLCPYWGATGNGLVGQSNCQSKMFGGHCTMHQDLSQFPLNPSPTGFCMTQGLIREFV